MGTVRFPHPFGAVSYEQMSTAHLQEALRSVVDDCKDYDAYALYEQRGTKFNLQIFNDGDRYIEDALFELDIPRRPEIQVADQIYYEPLHHVPLRIPGGLNYPTVEVNQEFVRISNEIGDLQHQRATQVFDEDVRMVVHPSLAGTAFSAEYRVFARNLPSPLRGSLRFVVAGET